MKNIDLKVCVGISFLGILSTCYLWTFVNGGNHWTLFGTQTERFLMKYGYYMVVFLSGCLVVPLLFKRDKKRVFIALMAFPVYIFLLRSLVTFLD